MAIGSLSQFLRHLGRRVAARDAAALTDCALVQRFAADGDEEAFAALVQRHGPLVLGICRRVLRREESAEDAFQATFLVLARKAGGLSRPEQLANWLYGVAWRVALKARADAGRRWLRQQPLAEEPADPSGPHAELDDCSAVLDEELRRLPEKFRAPLELCYLHGLTREEAAARLGCSAGAIKGLLERGREALRARLSRRGTALAPGALAMLLETKGLRTEVPGPLSTSTVRGALAFAAGPAPAAGRVAALAQEVLRAMRRSQWIAGAAGVVLVGLALAGAGALVYAAQAEQQPRPVTPAAPQPQQRQEKPAAALSFGVTGALNRASLGAESWGYCDGCVLYQDDFPLVCFGLNKRPGQKTRYLYLILFKTGPNKATDRHAEGDFRGSADGAKESLCIRLGDNQAIDLAYEFAADKDTHALVRETLRVGAIEVKEGDPRVFLVDLTQARLTYRPVKVTLPEAVPDLQDGTEKKTWGPTLLRAIQQLEEASPEVKKFLATARK
jgi:RNA polymerase sigma factor (sigma-70 family)